MFGNDPKSPRRPVPQSAQGPPGRGPVPEFTKIRSTSDLQPKVNAQPAFRRANPEGGFISVSLITLRNMMIIGANHLGFSPFKLSRATSPLRIGYATLASNMNPRGILVECSQSLAKVSKMMGSITKIATIFFM